MCEYSGNEFGAWYQDSCCIDGFLWDLDSGSFDDEGGAYLDHGGEIPCPECNAKSWVKYHADEFEDDGYNSADHPLTTKMVKNIFSRISSNRRRMAKRYWRSGRTLAIKENFE